MSFRKKYNWFYKWKVCAHNNPIMTLLLHEKVGLSSAEIFHKNFLIVASCTFSKFKIRILTPNKFKNQNSSTQKTVESLKRTTLEPDKVIISFDVTSLYTNVPVKEAIHETPDRLYSGDLQAPSPSWHPNLKFILEVE